MFPAKIQAALRVASIAASVIQTWRSIKQRHIIDDDPTEKETQPVANRVYDTQKFTRQHYDQIMDAWDNLQTQNKTRSKGEKFTQQDLADFLNTNLGMNKSIRSYMRVIKHSNREDFPV